jgi:hypothetical protein
MLNKQFCTLIVASSILTLTSGCTKSSSKSETTAVTPTLNTKTDSELFSASKNVSDNLKLEIKRQLLLAVSQSGIMKHIAGNMGNVMLTEIAVAQVEKTTQSIDVSVSGKVDQRTEKTPVVTSASSTSTLSPSTSPSSKPNPQSQTPPALNIGNLGVGIQTAYKVASSTYNVTLTFQEKNLLGGHEEIFTLQLKNPLTVEEEMSIASRVKLSVSAVKALPQGIAEIVARLFDDIALQIDAGNTFSRNSELSTRMYFSNKAGGYTELMRDFTTDVVQPLCSRLIAKSGGNAADCAIALPSIDNPLHTLEARLTNFVATALRCEKTALQENTLPIYKLYFAIPSALQVYTPEGKAFVYEAVTGGWKKIGWSTVVGQSTEGPCANMKSAEQCLIVRYGAHFFDEKCSAANAQKSKIGLYHEDKPTVLN